MATESESDLGSERAAVPAQTDVTEYGRQLAGDMRNCLQALQRSLAGIDTGPSSIAELPANIEIHYGYRVGGLGLLHDVHRSVHLTELGKVYRLPNTFEWCLGLANMRGNLTPVYDLAGFLFSTPAGRRNKLMVIGSDDDSAAMLIDDTPAQLRLDTTRTGGSTDDVPAFIREYISVIYRQDGDFWIQPDYPGLFRALAEQAEI